MRCIDELHTAFPWAGQRKIRALLAQEYQISAGRKLIRKLMAKMDLQVIYPKANLSKRHFNEALAPYLLRNYKVYLPNQVWSIDITYIRLNHGHIYLTALIDWYSRKIIGWNLSDTLEKESVIHAVEGAVAKYGSPAIINSDQGSQFSSEEYRETLKKLNIRQSMDGKSRWADNIMIKRWFRSLKTELIYINEFKSPRELKKAIRDYIARYNGKRPHEALNYKTPDEVYASKFAA